MSNIPRRNSATNRRSARRPNKSTSQPLARGRQPRTTRLPRMKVRNDSNQVLSLSGTDMFQLQSEQTNGFNMTCNVLANPLYWYGTRIAGIAKVYQKYKPRHIRFRYVPNCPATSSGSVTMGVIEAGVTLTPETAVTTLLNSGGKNINIYQSDAIDYYPKLKEACYIDGDIAKPPVNPFTFCMYTLKNADVPPGILYIDWEYDFFQGSGDQQLPIAVITTMTASQKLMLLSMNNELFTEATLALGWGTVLGFLKVVGVPILRKIGIVVCKTVLAWLSDDSKSNAVMTNTVTIRDASFLTIDPSDVYTSPAGKTRVKDANGSDYYLPDDARVAIYMSGDAIQKPVTASPPAPEPSPVPPSNTELSINFPEVQDFTAFTVTDATNYMVGERKHFSAAFQGSKQLSNGKFANFRMNIKFLYAPTADHVALHMDEFDWAYSISQVAGGDPTSDWAETDFIVNLYTSDNRFQEMALSSEAGVNNKIRGYYDCLLFVRYLYKNRFPDDKKAAWADIAQYL